MAILLGGIWLQLTAAAAAGLYLAAFDNTSPADGIQIKSAHLTDHSEHAVN